MARHSGKPLISSNLVNYKLTPKQYYNEFTLYFLLQISPVVKFNVQSAMMSCQPTFNVSTAVKINRCVIEKTTGELQYLNFHSHTTDLSLLIASCSRVCVTKYVINN